MNKEELCRAMIFVSKLEADVISDDFCDYVDCNDCPIASKCPMKEELDADEDAVPSNSCEEVVENYIRTGEIVDRRRENGRGSH